jgi:hypothetical protein
MILEKVVWTSLPNHADAQKRLRISVHVGPRLVNDDGSSTPGTLAQGAAFLDWPRRLATLRFRAEFDNGLARPARAVAAADGGLWRRLFPASTPLQPFAFQDHSRRDLHVFPVREVHAFLRQAYGAVAAAGADPPSLDDPLGPLAAFAPLGHLTTRITDSHSFYEELRRAQQRIPSPGRVVREDVASPALPGDQQAAQNAFFGAYRFYHRPGSQRPDLPEWYVEPKPQVPVLDFHQRVSALADFPQVLRMLGLVIELVIELEDPPANLPPTGMVRVVPEGQLPETPPMCPWTRYELDLPWFGARPANPARVRRGLLNLTPEFWDLVQVDVDGAALQVVGFADTLRRLRDPDRRSHATPDEATVPALRSAGLALARTRRGDVLLEDLRDRRGKNALIEAGHPPVFDAEDLVRGYRIDVRDADASGGARWFSLHRRVAAHEAPPAPGEPEPIIFTVTDEGYTKATAATSERQDHPVPPSDDLYLHETVVGWDGWSLAAPRPGKRLTERGEGDTPDSDVAREDPTAGNPPLVTRLSAEPRTLPRLRVGHRYRLRARTVDLAGNSRPFTEEDLEPGQPTLASPEQPYLRFEPVPSPTVLRRHRDTEGESLEHLVIRSDLGTTAAAYAASPAVEAALTEAGAAHRYAADSQRHLAPPKGSQQMAEQHGRLDAAFGGTAAAMTAALRVSLREEGTFLDPTIVDLATGQKTIAQSAIEVIPPGTPLPDARGAGLPDGAYAIYPGAAVLLPYLPDPLAIGVSLTGYDHAGSVVFHQVALFPGAWPGVAPFRLRLSEGVLGAAFAGGVLEVRLPQAEVVYARLASVFPRDRLGDFAVWRWIPPAALTADLEKAAGEGRHFMLTPFRWVTFTHAVQRPLVVPDATRIVPERALGDTYAEFRGPIANHAGSTGRLDVVGEWTEDVDLLTDDQPRMTALGTAVPHRAHAFGFDIEPTEDQAETAKPGRVSRHQLGDTKYRRIVYHAVATTRFREFLPRPIADDESLIQRVEAASGADGAPVPGLVKDVLSTARPAAPDVAYAVPTFRWERHDDGAPRRHVRRGGGVRVWLRRPWFSSGDGEQLAVVLAPGVRLPLGWERVRELELSPRRLAAEPPFVSRAPLRPRGLGTLTSGLPTRATRAFPTGAMVQPTPAPSMARVLPASDLVRAVGIGAAGIIRVLPPSDDEIRRMLVPYVTDWGIDPVWQSALPDRPPTVADFPAHTGFASALTLDELPPAARVVVAAHDVHWDQGRKLWYCDIAIDAGPSYFPFVRLALARYQPHSVDGAHLSRVAMTDFIQLAPDRTAEVTLARGRADVMVTGYSGRNQVAILPTGPVFGVPAGGPASGLGDVAAILESGPTGAEVVDRAGRRVRDLFGPSGPQPNTTMRVALQRRVPGVPGDLGWETVGAELTLPGIGRQFQVTWSGSVTLPADLPAGSHRLRVTESETYLRTDIVPGDPNRATSPLDFVRERVVYADAFEL